MRPTARFLSGCLGSLAWLSTQAICPALTRSAMNRSAGRRHARKVRDMHLDNGAHLHRHRRVARP
ncbi:hypothetical protein CCO03_00880 [Comamonas serinivorans]|uniref:Uncharacterized protein n=1 Tax=Comamonas serinivorans TaxID=1082851 RepID=A0A1Y0EII2_9BURK|nr:hypothetical protein CCO03_00880 [Comamonas serinivorans]